MMYTVAPLASKVLAIIKPIPWGEVQSTLGLYRCRLGASTYASAASDDSHNASEVEKVACSQGGEHCVRHDGLELAEGVQTWGCLGVILVRGMPRSLYIAMCVIAKHLECSAYARLAIHVL